MIIVFLFLTACATKSKLLNTQNFVKDYPNKGFLVGFISVRDTGRFYDNYEVLIRSDKLSRLVKINIEPKDIEKTQENIGVLKKDGYRGQYFVIPVMPGDYEIFDFNLTHNTSTKDWSDKARNEFSIPLSVVKSQATYVGELYFDQPSAMEFLSAKRSTNSFLIRDSFRRDVRFFSLHYPSIDWKNIQTVVASK